MTMFLGFENSQNPVGKVRCSIYIVTHTVTASTYFGSSLCVHTCPLPSRAVHAATPSLVSGRNAPSLGTPRGECRGRQCRRLSGAKLVILLPNSEMVGGRWVSDSVRRRVQRKLRSTQPRTQPSEQAHTHLKRRLSMMPAGSSSSVRLASNSQKRCQRHPTHPRSQPPPHQHPHPHPQRSLLLHRPGQVDGGTLPRA